MRKPLIKDEKIIFDNKITVEKATISLNVKGKEISFERMKIKRVDAVAVFINNTESKKIVLIKQFRYAIAEKTNEQILEIVAGKIDEGEDAETCAAREVEEECGYNIKKENLKKLAEFFVSPGYTSEKFFLYYVEVTNKDNLNTGGGLENENEYIEVVEMPYKEFFEMFANGEIQDGKTLTATLYVKLKGLVKY